MTGVYYRIYDKQAGNFWTDLAFPLPEAARNYLKEQGEELDEYFICGYDENDQLVYDKIAQEV